MHHRFRKGKMNMDILLYFDKKKLIRFSLNDNKD